MKKRQNNALILWTFITLYIFCLRTFFFGNCGHLAKNNAIKCKTTQNYVKQRKNTRKKQNNAK